MVRSGRKPVLRLPEALASLGQPTSWSTSRVLVALTRIDAPTSVRDVAATAGLAVSTTHRCLRELRSLGMVAWDDDLQNTSAPPSPSTGRPK